MLDNKSAIEGIGGGHGGSHARTAAGAVARSGQATDVAIGNEIVDLYKSRRPAPLAASWVADSEKAT